MKLLASMISVIPLFALNACVFAELRPDEVAIIANANSRESRAIAAYYAKQRRIPNGQICLIDVTDGNTISRREWAEKIRPAIRGWIRDKKLQSKIRCFVTTWDVPLKIGKREKADIDFATKRRSRFLARERQRRIARLNEFLANMSSITQTAQTLEQSATAEDIKTVFEKALEEANVKLQAMSELDRQPQIAKLQQYSIGTAGLNFVVQNLQNALAGQASQAVKAQLDFGRGRLVGISEGSSALDGLAPTAERDAAALVLVERARGILGTIAWIDAQVGLLDKNETNAAFDSELALILWGDYPLLRWQTNYLNYRFDGSPLRALNPTVMVCRLEAPTIKLTQSLIDTAIRIEKEGLSGKVYLDARGVGKLDQTNVQAGTPADYDRAILLAAKLLREHTNLEVVLNEETTLFAAGECPDAALYCGWYSLAKYIDAFDWQPGAIGYHMASNEAATLRTADSQVWCKRMLEDVPGDKTQGGVCGTLGPVFEPYLTAFPRPNEFLAAITCGKFTYAEAVYRTKSTNSWMMTIVGDPLYNPFKRKPALRDAPAAYRPIIEERN